MMTLISGGSGSGKSAFAEACVLQACAKNRIYLATMEVWGEEDRQRVRRHRKMRENKGFLTMERTRELDGVAIPQDSVVLLEDLSNLTANECFGGAGFDGAFQRVMAGIGHINENAADVVIVTNELFSDGITYPPETERYLELLGKLNRELAVQADRVYEVVAGIPICWKDVKK